MSRKSTLSRLDQAGGCPAEHSDSGLDESPSLLGMRGGSMLEIRGDSHESFSLWLVHGKKSCVTTAPELDYANVHQSRCLYISSFAFTQHQTVVRCCSTWTYRTSKCLGYTVTRHWSTESFNSEIGLSGGSLNADRAL